MGEMVINILLNLINVLETGVMMYGIFCVPLTKKKLPFIGGLLLCIGFCSGGNWERYDDIYVGAFGMLLTPVIWLLWTEGKWFRRIAIYICSMMYLGLPYFIINLFVCEISGKNADIWETYEMYRFVRGMITIVAVGILTICLWRKITGYKGILDNLPTSYFIVGSICAFTATMTHNFVDSVSREYENAGVANFISLCAVVVSLVFYGLGIGCVVLDIFRKRYKEESSLKEQYLQIARNYVRTVRDNARETRKIRHDIRNHMNILHYHLENGEYQKAQNYLEEMQSHMEQSIKKTMSVNHEIVDAVLFQQQSEMGAQSIRWQIEGALPDGLPIGDFDLCTIFSDLLSNSIEACRQVEEERRYIHLQIRSLDGNLVIEVENSCNGMADIEKLGGITSKKDAENHGYGIINMKDAVRKNHGEILFESTEDKFIVRIVFCFSVK